MTAGTENHSRPPQSPEPSSDLRIIWRPNRVVATIFSVFGGVAVIVSEIGGDKPVLEIFQKTVLAVVICGVLGWVAGWVLRLIFTEMADPEVPPYFEIPQELEGIKKIHGQQDSDESMPGEEVSPETQDQREGVMVSTDST